LADDEDNPYHPLLSGGYPDRSFGKVIR
jgi:hypothetical protein